jgi:hypothetical protein
LTSQESYRGRLFLGVAAFAVFLLAAWVDDARAAPGSIAGTVTSVATGAPIEGVEVCSSPVEWTQEPGQEGNVGGCTETGGDGTYLLANQMSLEYRVQFQPDEDEFVWEWYDDGGNWEAAEKVAVDSAPVTGIDAELDSPARVEGTAVAAADGLPVEGVAACAYRITDAYATCDWTASDGSFAIKVWYPGEYEIEFAPGFSGRELALQFYNRKDDWEDAEVLPIELSETIAGIDAELHPGGRISGRIVRPAANEIRVAQVCAIEAFTGRLWTCTWSEENGTYSLPYLAQGVYKVVFSPDLTEWFPGAENFTWGVPTQFWDNQATLAAATPISFGPHGGHLTGVDALYGPRPPKASPPPLVPVPLVIPPSEGTARKCPRGKKPKLVEGKRRCVKVKKHIRGHRRHKKGAAPLRLQTPNTDRLLLQPFSTRPLRLLRRGAG